MFRPRVIPVLLLKELGLVKSTNFKNYNYIGDPINSIKIFNDLLADELIFLDITANKENRKISLDFVKKAGFEANMPFGVGGGIKTLNDIEELIKSGAEKVILNSHALNNLEFIKEASNEFGSSTITISIDVKRTLFFGNKVFIFSGSKNLRLNPETIAKQVQDCGAGDIIINSIDNDGMMQGYDIPLINLISRKVTIPVVALGGASCLNDFKLAVNQGFASAVAAGSLFVYHGERRAVLINYPSQKELISLFK